MGNFGLGNFCAEFFRSSGKRRKFEVARFDCDGFPQLTELPRLSRPQRGRAKVTFHPCDEKPHGGEAVRMCFVWKTIRGGDLVAQPRQKSHDEEALQMRILRQRIRQ